MSDGWQVYKFGGSSLGTSGRLPRVLDLVAAAPRPLALVVSALGDSTDWLILAARSAEEGNISQARRELAQVRELATATARAVLGSQGQKGVKHDLDEILTPVERLLSGIELTRECSPRTLDSIISVGERISVALLARALKERDVPALPVDARDFVVTDNNFGAATVDKAETATRFAELKARWKESVPIVTGFIGRTRDGTTTTLGRNGSDYTATLVAGLLKASAVTVWTDVLGVMTADPALVHEASPVDRLSYDEALELAYFGTRMFHPRTIIPLRECGAALVIRSTTQPDAPGTRIDATGNPDPNRPTCVTSLERLALIGVQSRRTGLSKPVGGRILAALGEAGVRVWMTTESTLGQSFSVVIPEPDQQKAKQSIAEALAPEIQSGDLRIEPVLSPVTLVTLVGENMGRRPNVAGRFLNSIGSAGINVRAVAQGASARSISCVVDADQTATAVRTVHGAFNLAHTEINALLLGKGVVGGSLIKQIHQQNKALGREHDVQVKLVGVGSSGGVLFDEHGLATEKAVELQKTALETGKAVKDVISLLGRLAQLPNPVLVDCSAAPGMEKLYLAAFDHGVNVVSANKQPLALPQAQRDELLGRARRHFRAYHYETTVGAALPVIETLKNLVRTGDHVITIEGAFSGTLGFLCDQLAQGTALSVAVRTARERGYTEPHPRDDLSGLDVARKAVILARELGLQLDLTDVELKPFVPSSYLKEDDPGKFMNSLAALDQEFAARVAASKAQGRLPRYLARITPGATGAKVTVGPVEVEAAHPAAALRGAEAFVAFHTERYKEYPMVVRGAGAGGAVTAAGVLADILRLAQNIRGRG
ncbi:MAG TPA: bifunctional aspartate kinase/homoserine dehydrogenase I [Lacunisphaera sp.]|jgi:aspartokinase/homoserine dehydrogenase 1|nr:bifunctional aspartate kinase/homoserine dehydrogenase I [Lacunisphaera sp.]